MKLYAYSMSPMDFGWERMPTVKEYVGKSLDRMPLGEDYGWWREEINDLLAFVQEAMGHANALRWDGDFREGCEPRVLLLPDEERPALALVWKQENNGTTFCVSQRPMPWLKG